MMTSLERCLAAISGACPDRVPAYLPTVACDVASRLLGREAHTGSPTLHYASARAWLLGPSAYAEFQERVTDDIVALHRLLDVDVIRYGGRGGVRPSRQLDEWTFLRGEPDGAHEVWRYDPAVMNFFRLSAGGPAPAPEDFPARARALRAELPRRLAEIEATAGAREEALQRRLGSSMLVAVMGGGLGIGYDEASLMATVLEPGAVADLLDAQLELGLAAAESIARRGLKVMLGGGDMADKNGPLYSPAVFQSLMLPRVRRLAARCRELGLHYVWRTDGNLWKVADLLFEKAGIPGFGEADYDAGMTAGALRERYPRLVLWGNVSAAVLRRGTEARVYAHALDLLEAAGDTRYLHGCSNAVLPGTPPGNVLAMMKAKSDYDARRARSL